MKQSIKDKPDPWANPAMRWLDRIVWIILISIAVLTYQIIQFIHWLQT